MKISVVINTYNSERFLRECFDAVKNFDDVVICDMHSTDATLQIVEEYGFRLVFHEHTGIVEPARNFAISQSFHDWVLVVDSDEVVPNALREYLYHFVKEQGEQYAGLKIPRKNYFMGCFMHGIYPDHQLRLIRKSKTDWPVTIHAKPHINGDVTEIPGRRKDLAFEHLANETVSQRLEKMDRYTDMERIRRAGKKYSVAGAYLSGMHRFFKEYFLKGGFRDGRAGYTNAKITATYRFFMIAKLWENDT